MKISLLITETVKSGKWCRIDAIGGNVDRFEEAFAKLIDAKEAACAGSGTQALHTAVEALGIGSGDEINSGPVTADAEDSLLNCISHLLQKNNFYE